MGGHFNGLNMQSWDLDRLGRVRLSENFFFREFLHSEVGNFFGIPNIPDDPKLAIETGSKLCQEILEPLQKEYGRIHIRSGYRSSRLNAFCHQRGLGCASNEKNFARHIWDKRDAEGSMGATACIVLPSFLAEYEQTADRTPLIRFINDKLPCSELKFFKRQCAFNIGCLYKLL